MEKKLIDLHFEWMETGKLATPQPFDGGLCNLLPIQYKEYFNFFYTTDENRAENRKEDLNWVFWASGLPRKTDYINLAYDYTPLRQAIVLLICAMAGEL